MRAFYNEIDTYCCDWLSNLMDAGQITPGDICNKYIEDVFPDELRGYDRCHFFAGIGVWDYSLNLAGWGERPVWTGSAPCQPFSAAGKGAGFDDPRHQWPNWRWLIRECRPATIFGEQVAAASQWLGLVRCDLETLEYAVGAIPIEAASAGADHFRDRYWFVADSARERRNGRKSAAEQNRRSSSEDRSARIVVDGSRIGWGEGWTEHELRGRGLSASVASIDGCQYIECPDGKWRRLPPPRVRWLGNGITSRVAKLHAIGNAIDPRPAAEFIRASIEVIARPDLPQG